MRLIAKKNFHEIGYSDKRCAISNIRLPLYLPKFTGCDVNARNCLGCTALLYACGSGHVETVRALLAHPEIDVNRRNNDRLTSFMLAMQVHRSPVVSAMVVSSILDVSSKF